MTNLQKAIDEITKELEEWRLGIRLPRLAKVVREGDHVWLEKQVSVTVEDPSPIREPSVMKSWMYFEWVFRKIYPYKDEDLARRLHELAGTYQRRPQDGWVCPRDWDCFKDDGIGKPKVAKDGFDEWDG